MLSRRSVRIKVMQTLYGRTRVPDQTLRETMAYYRKLVEEAYKFYLLNVKLLVEVTAYAKIDHANKKAKLLPSELDKKFRPRLMENPASLSLHGSNAFFKEIQRYRLDEHDLADMAQEVYIELSQLEEYVVYSTALPSEDDVQLLTEDVAILQVVQKLIHKNPLFQDMVESLYVNYDVDKSMVVGNVKRTIKSLPVSEFFFQEYQVDPEIDKELGEALVRKSVEEDQMLVGLIGPNLKNWEMDRIAILDLILIKMAILEFVAFETIPTKVTLNEYVDIAKMYSTDKSREFVNGILDKMKNELIEKGTIVKVGRGLVD